jgi:hypothetical protein
VNDYFRQSVEVETQMTSVERILEYCELDQESSAYVSPKNQPPANWPLYGRISFHDVCMSHSKDPYAPLALNHISLIIEDKEKNRYCWTNRCWKKFVYSNT